MHHWEMSPVYKKYHIECDFLKLHKGFCFHVDPILLRRALTQYFFLGVLSLEGVLSSLSVEEIEVLQLRMEIYLKKCAHFSANCTINRKKDLGGK